MIAWLCVVETLCYGCEVFSVVSGIVIVTHSFFLGLIVEWEEREVPCVLLFLREVLKNPFTICYDTRKIKSNFSSRGSETKLEEHLTATWHGHFMVQSIMGIRIKWDCHYHTCTHFFCTFGKSYQCVPHQSQTSIRQRSGWHFFGDIIIRRSCGRRLGVFRRVIVLLCYATHGDGSDGLVVVNATKDGMDLFSDELVHHGVL
jgi:hypothetical protein